MSGPRAGLTLLHRGRRMAGMALARAWKQMSWFYYQYLLVTALYMLEPWERTVFSILCFLAWPGLGGASALGGGKGVLRPKEVKPRRSGSRAQFSCPRWWRPDFCRLSGGRRLSWCFMPRFGRPCLLLQSPGTRQGRCWWSKSLQAWASLTP